MILYIDTSSNFLYTGIVDKDNVVAEIKKEYGHDLSQVALPEIVSMFEKKGITPKDITKIIVVNGPGSFTGIRIGITIAKVYAWSLKVPITTITSLEAMATSSKSDEIKVPIIDARRGYCYAAIYGEEEFLAPTYITYEKLQSKLSKFDSYKVITNDKDLIKVDYDKIETYSPNILEIVKKYKDKQDCNSHAVNPDYLKLTEAEESKNHAN